MKSGKAAEVIPSSPAAAACRGVWIMDRISVLIHQTLGYVIPCKPTVWQGVCCVCNMDRKQRRRIVNLRVAGSLPLSEHYTDKRSEVKRRGDINANQSGRPPAAGAGRRLLRPIPFLLPVGNADLRREFWILQGDVPVTGWSRTRAYVGDWRTHRECPPAMNQFRGAE